MFLDCKIVMDYNSGWQEEDYGFKVSLLNLLFQIPSLFLNKLEEYKSL
jgi:hypothetical protein